LSETFLILRQNERDMIKKMYIDLHLKYPLFFSNFNETWIFLTDFKKILIYQILWKYVPWEVSCAMQMDRHITKLIVTFHIFSNAPKNI
jgi:hypothetical protein